jgi:hypothetical protein
MSGRIMNGHQLIYFYAFAAFITTQNTARGRADWPSILRLHRWRAISRGFRRNPLVFYAELGENSCRPFGYQPNFAATSGNWHDICIERGAGQILAPRQREKRRSIFS